MPERINFFSLFRQHKDGSIEPLRTVRIGGIQFGPGVRFGGGVSFGGIDLARYVGRDFSVEKQNDVMIILGIY